MELNPDALLAARLLTADPRGLGGIWLRGDTTAAREAICENLRSMLVVRPLPLSIDEDRLMGGIDVAASLAANRPIRHPGLLTEARDAVLLVGGAERMREGLSAQLAQARDAGGPALILADEGVEAEQASASLADRVAFHVAPDPFPELAAPGVGALDHDEVCEAIAAVAHALGVASSRASLFALRAARAHAALHGRTGIESSDLAAAIRLVLVPRATRMPEQSAPGPDERPNVPEKAGEEVTRVEDVLLEAVRTSLPADLIERLAAVRSRARTPGSRGTGARKRAPMRGRTVGARAGAPSGGARLALIETLRAAAPWQGVRGRGDGQIILRKDDLRVRRHEDREVALTIFAVDASGSAAFARLAEAKGAVELLLARAYARRAEVALIAFRGAGAELLLPPTRSLTRARRSLAELPGGGGTPLAAGLDAARGVAEAARQRGRTPQLVVLTDGRANIALSGQQDRALGTADAFGAARRVAAAGLRSVVIDIGTRAQPEAAALAAAMGARLIHMPRADASAMSAAAA